MSVPLAYLVVPLLALGRLFGKNWFLILSDVFPGDRSLAALFGHRCARMLWNYVTEFPPERVAVPARRLLFFDPPDSSFERFVFGPQPDDLSPRPASFDIGVSYVGDVSLDFDLGRAARDWWIDQLDALYARAGASLLLMPEFAGLLDDATTNPGERLAARLLAKNYARLRLVKAAKTALGDRMTVFGSNWAAHGIACPAVELLVRLSSQAVRTVEGESRLRLEVRRQQPLPPVG